MLLICIHFSDAELPEQLQNPASANAGKKRLEKHQHVKNVDSQEKAIRKASASPQAVEEHRPFSRPFLELSSSSTS